MLNYRKSEKCSPKVILMEAVGFDAINMAIECCHNSLTKFCYDHQIDAAEFSKLCQHKTECKYKIGHNCIWVNMYGPVYCGFMKNLGLDEFKKMNFEYTVGSPEARVKLAEKVFRYVYIKSRYDNLQLFVPRMLIERHATDLSILKQFTTVSKTSQSRKSSKVKSRKLSMKTVLSLVSELTIESA